MVSAYKYSRHKMTTRSRRRNALIARDDRSFSGPRRFINAEYYNVDNSVHQVPLFDRQYCNFRRQDWRRDPKLMPPHYHYTDKHPCRC